MDFYALKGKKLPRFLYRNFADALRGARTGIGRNKIVDDFCDFIEKHQPAGETQKMKWCLPVSVAQILSDVERAKVDLALSAKRRRRNERLLEVYPHCSDEFSLHPSFLDASFGEKTLPLIDKHTKAFTFGSCFARNIALYLKSEGYNASTFVQNEDLNSPFSNAIMLQACLAPEADRRRYISHWIGVLYPEAEERDMLVEDAIAQVESLRSQIAEAEFLIMTCGNVVDYFLHDESPPFPGAAAVAPKFISVSFKEDVELRGKLTQRLKAAGSSFRLGSTEEVENAIEMLYKAIREINPTAQLLITLSPIPIESVMGIETPYKMGAVEVDCISKSILRAAIHTLMQRHSKDEKLVYFPSFEVIRWIAPGDVFGAEDAASRHVSQKNLTGVCEYFVHKFGRAPEEIEQTKITPSQGKRRWWQLAVSR